MVEGEKNTGTKIREPERGGRGFGERGVQIFKAEGRKK